MHYRLIKLFPTPYPSTWFKLGLEVIPNPNSTTYIAHHNGGIVTMSALLVNGWDEFWEPVV